MKIPDETLFERRVLVCKQKWFWHFLTQAARASTHANVLLTLQRSPGNKTSQNTLTETKNIQLIRVIGAHRHYNRVYMPLQARMFLCGEAPTTFTTRFCCCQFQTSTGGQNFVNGFQSLSRRYGHGGRSATIMVDTGCSRGRRTYHCGQTTRIRTGSNKRAKTRKLDRIVNFLVGSLQQSTKHFHEERAVCKSTVYAPYCLQGAKGNAIGEAEHPHERRPRIVVLFAGVQKTKLGSGKVKVWNLLGPDGFALLKNRNR